MLLIIGGTKDHNCNRLAQTAQQYNIPYRLYHTDTEQPPSVFWESENSQIIINGETFEACETMVFARHDIFSTLKPDAHPDQQARNRNWYDAIKGWALANQEVALLNRGNENLEVSKPRVLKLAKECGFELPKSWITNDFNSFSNPENYIAKPVSGGEHTVLLSDLVNKQGAINTRPYIVQEKLIYPEMRLFRVGNEYFGLSIQNETLDSREGKNLKLQEMDVPQNIIDAMEKLTDHLGLDYSAADFKTCAETGALKFLEINTMPMMTGYDNVLQGYLSLAMIDTLESIAAQNQKASPAYICESSRLEPTQL